MWNIFGTGVTRECVVLYGPENTNYEDYGIQITPMETVANVTLGYSDFTLSMNQYNDVINILNNTTSKYLNITYAESVRCIGSVPDNPSYDGAGMHITQFGGSYSGDLKDTDENYLSDWDRLINLNIYNIESTYWLASRYVYPQPNYSYYYVRSVNASGGLTSSMLCNANYKTSIYGYTHSLGLRPVFTLKSDIKVTGGTGEPGDPYTLGV